jgi:hypothetical protein
MTDFVEALTSQKQMKIQQCPVNICDLVAVHASRISCYIRSIGGLWCAVYGRMPLSGVFIDR